MREPSGPVAPPRPPIARGVDVWVLIALLAPLAGLFALLAIPNADLTWEHHPSHFWLVLGTAAIAAALGWAIGVTARRRADARLFLVSLAFVTSASFLGLHALATPGVLLDGPNEGFVIATPVGLLLASGFALWSSLPLDGGRARWVIRRSSALRLGVVIVVIAWGAWSMAALPPLDGDPPRGDRDRRALDPRGAGDPAVRDRRGPVPAARAHPTVAARARGRGRRGRSSPRRCSRSRSPRAGTRPGGSGTS